jgi:HTH-type transcriptional regulator/antitoxin HigA
LPDVSPLQVLQYFMEQRGLRQADLLPVFGSRSIASAVLNGKREFSKAHIRKLAEFFHVSPAVFL